MHEACNPSGCPVSARVDALKDEFDRCRGNSSKTHEQMFSRIGALEQNKAALAWVSVSYLIAICATVKLAQPFPVVELSQQAITTILGMNALKVVENILSTTAGPYSGTQKNEPPPVKRTAKKLYIFSLSS